MSGDPSDFVQGNENQNLAKGRISDIPNKPTTFCQLLFLIVSNILVFTNYYFGLKNITLNEVA